MDSRDEQAEGTGDFGSPVQIEAFGVSGALGRPAGQVRRAFETPLQDYAIWHPETTSPGTHVAFAADFSINQESSLTLRFQGTESFRIWVDGELVAWGPHRYAVAMPELASLPLRVGQGDHRIAVHAVHVGLTNRIATDLPPFLSIHLSHSDSNTNVPLQWRSRILDEYVQTGLRVSPLQGWFEWLDRPLDRSWIKPGCSVSDWSECALVSGLSDTLGPTTLSDLNPPEKLPSLVPLLVDSGLYRDTYTAYRWDDPSVQFLLADRSPRLDDDLDGTYWVFDLGRIRIGALELEISCAGPIEVTIAYGERKGPDGQVSPSVALSAGRTMFLQHFAVDAEHSTIVPIQPLGARWLEVRLRGDLESRISHALFRERDYLGEPGASIDTGEERLNKIWQVGLDTLRSSAEDSLVDSVRERGEWVGDVSIAGMELASVGWARVEHARRALLHSAVTARDDGLVSGCGPGELIYLGTYAMHWMSAVVRCAELEGHTSLLDELRESGEANMSAILNLVNDDGTHTLPWSFIDWGYLQEKGEPDIATLCHVIRACRAWRIWHTRLGLTPGQREAAVDEKEAALRGLLSRYSKNPEKLGYHALVLLAHLGEIPGEVAGPRILSFMEESFPFTPDARRLRDCTDVHPNAITPYFTNYSMEVIIRSLGIDVALDLWRRGWGWMLDRGATTWWEVFDERWSQCHYWSGAPTWQLSRKVIGLNPSWQDGKPLYDLSVRPGSLPRASARIGGFVGQFLTVEWTRQTEDSILYRLQIDQVATFGSEGTVGLELEPGVHEFELVANGDVFVMQGAENA